MVLVISILYGLGFALIGGPFALATVVPFGRFRRVLVSVGVAAFGGIVSAIVLGILVGPLVVLALPVAAGLFYLAYRVAR